MPKLIDLSGNTYSRLTVIEKDPDYQKRNGLSNKKLIGNVSVLAGKLFQKMRII